MDILRIKSRLLVRRYELLARYHDELARVTEELESRESDDGDQASEQWDARVLSILSNADAAALGRIVAALRRLDTGNYGTCTECTTAIEPARLFVLPETPTCFECAIEAERAGRAPRGSVALRAAS